MFSVSAVRGEKSIKGLVFNCNSHEVRAEEREENAGKGRVRAGKGRVRAGMGRDVAVCHL